MAEHDPTVEEVAAEMQQSTAMVRKLANREKFPLCIQERHRWTHFSLADTPVRAGQVPEISAARIPAMKV